MKLTKPTIAAAVAALAFAPAAEGHSVWFIGKKAAKAAAVKQADKECHSSLIPWCFDFSVSYFDTAPKLHRLRFNARITKQAFDKLTTSFVCISVRHNARTSDFVTTTQKKSKC